MKPDYLPKVSKVYSPAEWRRIRRAVRKAKLVELNIEPGQISQLDDDVIVHRTMDGILELYVRNY